MGVKGFQKGHIVSKETRMKISKANDGNFFAKCDYCTENGMFLTEIRQAIDESPTIIEAEVSE